MERALIYLRAGSVIELKAKKFMVTHNSEIVSHIKWEGNSNPQLIHLDFTEVVAVTIETLDDSLGEH